MQINKPISSGAGCYVIAVVMVLCVIAMSIPYSVWAAKNSTDVYVGSVVTIYVGTITRVVVGNENIVEATVIDNGNLLLLGKAPGISEIYIWTKGDRQKIFKVRVYPQPQSDQLGLVRSVVEPFPNVKLKQQLGNVILSGKVDARAFERYTDLVGNLKNVISLVQPELNIDIQKSIVLDVNILEINRSYQRTLGIRWQDTAAGPAFGLVSNIIPNNKFGVFSDTGDDRLGDILSAVGTGSSTASGYFGITSILGSQIQLLQDQGVARVLASPSLSTVSGEKASFLAGGDFPTAVLNEFGQPVVEFRQFGIQLEIQPVMDRHNNIRSTIRAEMSSIDFSIQVNGVPGLRRRETVSTITARPGETIIISGLVNAQDSRNADKVPGLAEIPILGRLFRSDDFQQQRTELVVTVTPRIQAPNAPIDKDLADADRHLKKVLDGSEELDKALLW